MIAIREYIKVVDHKINITLPEQFNFEEVEVVIMPKNNSDLELSNDEDSQNIGKIGFHS